MSAMTSAERIANHEAAARAALAAGFDTKAAQNAARVDACWAYSYTLELVQAVFLELPRRERTEEREAAYFDLPSHPHLWRAKHADAIRTHLPAGAKHIEALERLVALAALIKAAPITDRTARKRAEASAQVQRLQALNPQLRGEFEKRIPALRQDWLDYMTAAWAGLSAKFPAGIPAHPRSSEASRADAHTIAVLGQFCDLAGDMLTRHTLAWSDRRAELAAQRYAQDTALQWFCKTNGKLGQLDSATLIEDDRGHVVVAGKRNGAEVYLRQQRVLKFCPSNGRPFHQFPASLYIDGKHVSEAEYVQRFGA